MSLNLEKAKELIDIKLMKTNNSSGKNDPLPPLKKNKTPKPPKKPNKPKNKKHKKIIIKPYKLTK